MKHAVSRRRGRPAGRGPRPGHVTVIVELDVIAPSPPPRLPAARDRRGPRRRRVGAVIAVCEPGRMNQRYAVSAGKVREFVAHNKEYEEVAMEG